MTDQPPEAAPADLVGPAQQVVQTHGASRASTNSLTFAVAWAFAR